MLRKHFGIKIHRVFATIDINLHLTGVNRKHIPELLL